MQCHSSGKVASSSSPMQVKWNHSLHLKHCTILSPVERCRPSSDTQGNAHGIALGYTLVWLDLSHCSRCTQMLMSIGHNLSCQLAAGRLEMLGKCMFEKALLETQLLLKWVKDRVTSLRTKFKLIFKQSYLNTGTSYE